MARPLRYLPPDCPLVEVTCRTLHGRMLLRPSRELNQRVLGVLARAARLYDVSICAFVFLSNHYHLLLRPKDALELARFMNYLNSNIAREAGRLHSWRERFWGRRYRPVPISFEPEAQIARLEYLLGQGCKEGLVAKPQDWPGVTATHALLDGSELQGVWYDRTGEYWARKRREQIEPDQFTTIETLRLAPLPCWEQLDPDEARARVADIVDRIATETRRRHREARTRPLGVRRILRQSPHHRPSRVARSPAPRFHAASRPTRRMLEQMYRAFRDAYRDAMESLRKLLPAVRFPSHGIPPPAAA